MSDDLERPDNAENPGDPENPGNIVDFDEAVALALADLTAGPAPRASVRTQLLERIAESAPVPTGFAVHYDRDDDWTPHPVPGIRMKVLSRNRRTGYATLLLDVQPGTRFPAHHHDGDEECYVISGSILTLNRRLGPGDFVHADHGTDHGELWTDVGARVLLVVPAEDYM
jgi:quercetin dioxygenase-like cupin family protein